MYLKGSCILFVYGEGGHAAQMNRLAPFIFDKVGDKIFLSLSDSKLHPSWSSKHFVSGEFRSKSRHSDWLFNKGPIEILKSLLEIRKSYKVVAVISTGPVFR
ncbi:hypothetical protein TUM17382_14960 [Shewanella algae]|nr:hypothetical protein TUM17382_14960 [Shewanella algae]